MGVPLKVVLPVTAGVGFAAGWASRSGKNRSCYQYQHHVQQFEFHRACMHAILLETAYPSLL